MDRIRVRTRRRSPSQPARRRRAPQDGPPPADLILDSALVERYWLPEHDRRRHSPRFLRNKRLLRDQIRLPCWVCRTRGTRTNPLEVHHIFEWALWNALDPARVTRILEVLEFYEEGYLAAAGPRREALEAALAAAKASGPLRSPDDVRNLVVTCFAHHRARFTGAHMINFPLWLALAALRPGLRGQRRRLEAMTRAVGRVDDAVAEVVGGRCRRGG